MVYFIFPLSSSPSPIPALSLSHPLSHSSSFSLSQVASLNDETPTHDYLSLGSSLLTSFEGFILCLFIHMMSLVSTTFDWHTVMEANQEVSYTHNKGRSKVE